MFCLRLRRDGFPRLQRLPPAEATCSRAEDTMPSPSWQALWNQENAKGGCAKVQGRGKMNHLWSVASLSKPDKYYGAHPPGS